MRRRLASRVDAGELLALIGPNGAGKTTCFNMLNGQLAPDAGSVRLDGRDIAGLRAARRSGASASAAPSRSPRPSPRMTVRENVQMALLSHHRPPALAAGARARRCSATRPIALLDQVGMLDQAERACGVLAYGDLKRVELAVALANEPRLLLMDEPTAGMAPKERIALMALTAGIARERQHRRAVHRARHGRGVRAMPTASSCSIAAS